MIKTACEHGSDKITYFGKNQRSGHLNDYPFMNTIDLNWCRKYNMKHEQIQKKKEKVNNWFQFQVITH